MIGDRETDGAFAANLGVRFVRMETNGRFPRFASLRRTTKETDVSVFLNVDGSGATEISTGIGFFDHMLELLAKHALLDLSLHCQGDLPVDEHHTVEDTGLALGIALAQAIGDKRGIERYGFVLPMDEALAEVALDLSGRPCLVFTGSFRREHVGELPTELVPHFFESFAQSLRCGLHMTIRRGKNEHHKIEALFKGLGRCLRQAFRGCPHERGVPFDKGGPVIGLLHYNAGNRASVARALDRLEIRAQTVETSEEIAACDGLIFPGAGAAQSAMRDLYSRGLVDALRDFRKPFLGLCLGMQLLFDFSEEGNVACLGIVRGRVKELPDDVMKPHMGWNRLDTGRYAYFAHSYFCVPDDPRVVTMTARHGVVFCAGLHQRNFFGVQWHPEKSGETGDRFLRSFAALCRGLASSRADVPVCQVPRGSHGRQECLPSCDEDNRPCK